MIAVGHQRPPRQIASRVICVLRRRLKAQQNPPRRRFSLCSPLSNYAIDRLPRPANTKLNEVGWVARKHVPCPPITTRGGRLSHLPVGQRSEIRPPGCQSAHAHWAAVRRK